MKMPPIVTKLKGEKCFQLHCICSDRLFAVLLSLALSIFHSPLSVTYLKLRVILRPLYNERISLFKLKKSSYDCHIC
jgi:hypothetical protein